MRRSTSLLALTLLLGPPSLVAAAEPHWLTSVDAATKTAREQKKLVFVDLYADWCGWCKELDKQVFSTPQFQSYAAKFVLLRVNTDDGREGSALQNRFAAESLPTTLLLDPDFVQVGRVEGFAPTQEFLGMLDQQIAEFRQYEKDVAGAVAGSDTKKQRELAGEAHQRGDGPRAAALYRRLLASGTVPKDVLGALQYMLADALRIAKNWGEARQALVSARQEAQRLADSDLIERTDLLAFSIAQDSGDCRGAKNSLEQFLREHPKSTHVREAQRTLHELQTDKSAQCT